MRRMAQREEETDPDRPLAVLHELARDVVDRGDVIGVDRMPQAERVGQQRGAEQDRVATKMPRTRAAHAPRLRAINARVEAKILSRVVEWPIA